MLEMERTEHERRAEGLAALQAQLTFRFSVLSKLLDRQMAEIAAREGLNLIGYRLLVTIEAFGTLSAADLARYTAYDKAAISRQLSVLEEEGLISSRPDPDHGRRRMLSLTPRGSARIAALAPAVQARRDDLAGQLSKEEEAALLSAIDRLSAHLDRKLRRNG